MRSEGGGAVLDLVWLRSEKHPQIEFKAQRLSFEFICCAVWFLNSDGSSFLQRLTPPDHHPEWEAASPL